MNKTRFVGAAFCLLFAALAHGAEAQVGGFVVTLGSDTLHVESFTRTPDRIIGTIVTRSPVTRVAHYSMNFTAAGVPTRYEVETRQANGTPIPNGTKGSITYVGDSVVRETLRQGETVTHRMAAAIRPFPGPSLPYVGVSYLMYELAFADARRRSSQGETEIALLTMSPGQSAPQRLRAWLVSPDSAELDYFGVARSGYRFNARGELTRADWRNTTYRYVITRVGAIDVEKIARAWSEADAKGGAMGAISPRDTTRATIDAATITVDYSRPAKRGRVVWGEVVPWNRVWRLGADFATHFTTSANLRVGDVDVPAGAYTIWMLPFEGDSARLIINSQTRIFGTNYNAARDFARVPLRRSVNPVAVERLTISVEGGFLWIRWDDVAWSVPIATK